MFADYKSRELNLYRDEGYKFRVIPHTGDSDLPYAFELKTTNYSNAGNWGVYIESLFSSVGNVTRPVGSMLFTHEHQLSQLGASLMQETFDRQSNDTKLSGDLANEISARTAGDLVHTADIAAEVAARVAADYALQNSLNNEVANRQAADTVHTQSIAQAEINLSAEANARAAADTKLASDLSIESKARADADAATSAALATETASRLAEDTKLTQDLSAEVALRTSEVKRLDGRVDFIIHNVDPVALDSLSEIVSHFNNNGAGYAARLSFLEGVVQELLNKTQ